MLSIQKHTHWDNQESVQSYSKSCCNVNIALEFVQSINPFLMILRYKRLKSNRKNNQTKNLLLLIIWNKNIENCLKNIFTYLTSISTKTYIIDYDYRERLSVGLGFSVRPLHYILCTQPHQKYWQPLLLCSDLSQGPVLSVSF